MRGAIPPLLQYDFMAWCSVKQRDFTFYTLEQFIKYVLFLGSTAQLRPWPPSQNPAEFLGGLSTIFFFTG
jgi:hypothetical protein